VATDRFGRDIHYLRISLTDLCNLRCVYCMPEDAVFRPPAELMQDDEVLRLARLFAGLGFDKFRLTGGEPTVRAGVVGLVRELSAISGVREVTMTTNGTLLSRFAAPLAEAGLHRVNVSLDTLDPARFRRITRLGSLENVWEGIEAAECAGLAPIKINTVVVRGHNDGPDLVGLARLTRDRPWQVRFIEMMPFGRTAAFAQAQIVTADEIKTHVEAALGPLEPADGGRLDGEARSYRLPGAEGTLGFISSVSAPFCLTCTRVRLTADGRLRLCLLREKEVDLLTPLRAGASEETLRRLIRESIWDKPWGHGLAEDVVPANRDMSEIGG
jgi:cyclic pyranopterin phosphate synthase